MQIWGVVLVFEGVDGDGHVPGLLRARVNVAVVFRDEIDIVKDEALEIILAQRLGSPNVHQHGSIERSIP